MTDVLPATAGASPATMGIGSVAAGRIGVLLINLGTPEAADPPAVRRYLREFLSDARVIENQGPVWKLVLEGIILPLRPRQKARDYAKIWNRERNESPLKTITRAQAEKLGATLTTSMVVDWAMRYGQPSIADRLADLVSHGCDRILVVPLYPQYCAATTATVCDHVFRALMRMRYQPSIRVALPYFADPVYIEALATSTTEALAKLDFTPEVMLASFHGVPQEYVDKGDPYASQCMETMRLLRQRLAMNESRLLMTFQSRFGRAQWLEPATDHTVRRLAESGVKSIAVLTPGFAADCLETLEEIAVENADIFRHHGGVNFAAIPCLNDSPAGMRVITALVQRELAGWV
ncbi:MAG: ferrochelatase [Hyphomicrobiales bacterium]|nr:ferrochelatase [Hyphomicrobiales bacterium]